MIRIKGEGLAVVTQRLEPGTMDTSFEISGHRGSTVKLHLRIMSWYNNPNKHDGVHPAGQIHDCQAIKACATACAHPSSPSTTSFARAKFSSPSLIILHTLSLRSPLSLQYARVVLSATNNTHILLLISVGKGFGEDRGSGCPSRSSAVSVVGLSRVDPWSRSIILVAVSCTKTCAATMYTAIVWAGSA